MKYKIGDKVKYLKNTTSSNAIVGEEYYIVTITNAGIEYSLGKDKGKHTPLMRVNEKDIELVEEYKEYKEGEEVEVSDNTTKWNKRIFLTTLPGRANIKYITVSEGDEDKYLKGENFDITRWRYIRKLKKEEERKIICSEKKWQEIQKILKLNK